MSHKHVPNSARRRTRKEQLARRHGARCAYCRRPFATLREATLDHIAPYSLWRTWSVTALVLACPECNGRKADRLPLSMALLLTRATRREHPTVHTPVGSGVHAAAFTTDPEAFTNPFTLATWRLLARLAHTNQAATYEAVRGAVQTPVQGRTAARSGPYRQASTLVRSASPRPYQSDADPYEHPREHPTVHAVHTSGRPTRLPAIDTQRTAA